MPPVKGQTQAVDTTDPQAVPKLPANPDHKTVIISTPIMRGATKITEVVLRKPNAGDMRGIKLIDVLQMDTTAIGEVVPRISTTGMTKVEFFKLDLPDAMAIIGAVVDFMDPNSDTQTE